MSEVPHASVTQKTNDGDKSCSFSICLSGLDFNLSHFYINATHNTILIDHLTENFKRCHVIQEISTEA